MPTQNDLLLNSIKTGDFEQLFGSRIPETDLDAFGRLRVSEPTTIFDCQFQYDKQPLLWEESSNGAANSTHLSNESAVSLNVGTSADDFIVRQTKQYFRYQPGKSQFVLLTFCFGESTSNNSQRVGYFDSENGIFLEYANSVLSICKRTKTSGNVVTTTINQTDWNVDKLSGTGFSKLTLDPTKSQIFFLDLEWLGVGRVRTGFVINGAFYIAHEFLHANIIDSVYMTTANLPVRHEIRNSGTSVASSLKTICTSVISEGGFEEDRGIPFAISNGITPKSINARKPLISISPANTFNSVPNHIHNKIDNIDIHIDTGTLFVEIVYNGTLTNAAFSNVSTNNSGMLFDVSANAISNGIVIESFYVVSTVQSKSSLQINLKDKLPFSIYNSGANSDIITIVGTPFTGTIAACAGFGWKEIR